QRSVLEPEIAATSLLHLERDLVAVHRPIPQHAQDQQLVNPSRDGLAVVAVGHACLLLSIYIDDLYMASVSPAGGRVSRIARSSSHNPAPPGQSAVGRPCPHWSDREI